MTRPKLIFSLLLALFLSALVPVRGAVPEPTDLNNLDLSVRLRVRAIYFAPSDRPFPDNIRERLDVWLRHTREFYRDEMRKNGYLDEFGRGKTFVIDEAEDGLWDIVFMRGEHPASYYQADPGGAPGACMGEMYGRLPSAFHNNNVVMYLYDTWTTDGVTFQHTGNGGLGADWEGPGAGWVLQGTHFLGNGFDIVTLDPADQASVFQDTQSSGITESRWDGSWGELTRGEFASTYFAVPIHELGHAFYMGHIFTDTDGDGDENNLMGNGFRHFGGRFGMEGPDASPTILAPESAAHFNDQLMFNQDDPFDIWTPPSGLMVH